MSIYDYVNLGANSSDQIEAFAPLIPPELFAGIKSGAFLALGQLLADMPDGVAVFETQREQAFLRSFYVYEYDRRHGAGTELLNELCHRLASLGGIYSIGACLPLDCDDGVKAFFEKNGFELYNGESMEAVIPRSKLEALTLPTARVKCFSGDEIDASMLKKLESELKKKGQYLLEGDLNEEPVISGLCRYAVENGAITAAAVITKVSDGLCLAYLYGENGAAVSAVLSAARDVVLPAMKEGELLHMELVNESSEKLAKRLVDESMLYPKRFARKPIMEVEL